MNGSENVIGTAEAAKMLGKSHRTVHRLVEAGALVPVMTAPGGFKGAFLFKREVVEQIKSEREAAA